MHFPIHRLERATGRVLCPRPLSIALMLQLQRDNIASVGRVFRQQKE
jgi:hypothetical protein